MIKKSNHQVQVRSIPWPKTEYQIQNKIHVLQEDQLLKITKTLVIIFIQLKEKMDSRNIILVMHQI